MWNGYWDNGGLTEDNLLAPGAHVRCIWTRFAD